MRRLYLRFILGIAVCLLSTSKAIGSESLHGVTFRVFCAAQMAPFSFINDNWQSPEGIDIDILLELQKRLGFELENNRIIPVPQDLAVYFLQSGKSDISIGGVAATYEREKIFSFSRVYSQSALGIVKRSNDNEITCFSSLKGKRVAVVSRSDAYDYVTSVLKESQIIEIPQLTKGFFMVYNDQCDVLVADRYALSYFVDTVPSIELTLLTDAFNLDAGRMAMVFNQNFAYKDIINQELDRMMADGTVEKINRKWRTKSSY